MNNIEYEYYYAILEDNEYIIKPNDDNYKNIEKQIKTKLINNITICEDEKT